MSAARRLSIRTSSSQGSRAVVVLTDRRYAVRFESHDLAWFDFAEKKNADDFCNGFNEGYMRGRAVEVALDKLDAVREWVRVGIPKTLDEGGAVAFMLGIAFFASFDDEQYVVKVEPA